MEPDRYLERIGVDPASVDVGAVDLDTVGRLQHAHVGAVPFENLAIVGDPFDDADDGAGVVLALPHLYEKVVERERGGYCFELNGLFGWLLAELGVDTHRVAARVVGDDGDATPPANHHTNVVAFDRRYLVDVGMGTPTMRRPLPVGGEVVTGPVGVDWRVVESDRPDETHLTQYRRAGDDDWQDRYLFTDEPRELGYFEATCDYLQSAPESTFTGDPIVTIATETGHARLKRDSFVRESDGDEREEPVAPDEWHDVLKREFGLEYRSP
ncbi:arylamine N-acetyltransferase family protein [Haloarchaeobius baliensis]|uniref:arylamine N-acetyltransferase family protein n=1 Tax=Haloarchaeobius baliensis TaxID=1670458 RepID=UPI003F883160